MRRFCRRRVLRSGRCGGIRGGDHITREGKRSGNTTPTTVISSVRSLPTIRAAVSWISWTWQSLTSSSVTWTVTIMKRSKRSITRRSPSIWIMDGALDGRSMTS
uniref:Uncharacterized protein n=1 Tax=Cacopsylla melanoneura TaxID=428564 RepID=A0A8D8Q841_9HEMI